MASSRVTASGTSALVAPLQRSDLPEADRIFRLAFGTFLGLPNPIEFAWDADFVRTRWAADPSAAFGAYLGKDLVGSNFATRWGSVAFFGPLTVRPDLWNQGIAKRMMEPILDLFINWTVKHEALFTFAHSPKHIALYQRFGFWPRFLTAIMSKPVSGVRRVTEFSRFSEIPASQREDCLRACREMTDSIYEGLDVERGNPGGGCPGAWRHCIALGRRSVDRFGSVSLRTRQRGGQRLLLYQVWRGEIRSSFGSVVRCLRNSG
jgi:GNAT superfamily N-acetyltransferase